ncbi:TPA: DNA adenine methylase, partial [Enterococcus faecalis]|nr:DNA adenine methylase [Enterococcus faecalis]
NNYYEPFLGGGAVYFNINAKHYYVNDKSKELMDFYKNIASQNESISYCYRN